MPELATNVPTCPWCNGSGWKGLVSEELARCGCGRKRRPKSAVPWQERLLRDMGFATWLVQGIDWAAKPAAPVSAPHLCGNCNLRRTICLRRPAPGDTACAAFRWRDECIWLEDWKGRRACIDRNDQAVSEADCAVCPDYNPDGGAAFGEDQPEGGDDDAAD